MLLSFKSDEMTGKFLGWTSGAAASQLAEVEIDDMSNATPLSRCRHNVQRNSSFGSVRTRLVQHIDLDVAYKYHKPCET